MTISLKDVTAFLAVYESGGVNAASRRLSVSKSVISSRLSSLEEEIGTPLFIRSTKSTTPTGAGTLFYQRASAVARSLEDAVEDVRPENRGLCGTLRIAAPVSFTLARLQAPVIEFAGRHPELRVSVSLNDEQVDLATGVFDLAVRVGRLRDSTLKARKLASARRVLCASPAYLSERGTPKSLADLIDHDTIGYANAPISREWEFKDASSDTWDPVKVVPRFVSNNGETMRAALLAGLGLCAIPEFLVADDLESGQLVRVLAEYELTLDGIYCVYMPGREQSKKVRAFIDHLVSHFGGAALPDSG
ncbi:MAG: LysR family transcriptional regulator [Pseudomonadota bacterium]